MDWYGGGLSIFAASWKYAIETFQISFSITIIWLFFSIMAAFKNIEYIENIS